MTDITSEHDRTRARTRVARNQREPMDRFAEAVYEELRSLARRYLRRSPGYYTLQATDLVHEAYVRLKRAKHIVWQGKTHFLAVAATQMRRILVEQVRAATAQKRGAGLQRVTLSEQIAEGQDRTVEILVLMEALQDLEKHSPRRSRVAELRLFSGLSVDEIARVVKVSPRTVKQDWRLARAWLTRELDSSAGHSR